MRKRTVLALALALILGFSTAALAERPLVLRLGHPMAPGNNVTVGYEKFRRGVFSICRPHGCLRTEEGLGDATGHAADDAFWNLRPPEKL